jgi:hypothetical protein
MAAEATTIMSQQPTMVPVMTEAMMVSSVAMGAPPAVPDCVAGP